MRRLDTLTTCTALLIISLSFATAAVSLNGGDEGGRTAGIARQLLQTPGKALCRLRFGRQCKYCIRHGNPRCTGVVTPKLFTIRDGRPVPKPGVEPRPVQYDPIGARACRPGYIKSAAGNYACFKCKGDTYSPSLGGTKCRKCNRPRRVNSARTTCTAPPTPKPTKKPAPSCIPAKGTFNPSPSDDTYLIANGGSTDFSDLNAENYRIDGGRGWAFFTGTFTPNTDFFAENNECKLVTMPNGQVLAVGGGLNDYANTALFFDVESRLYCKTGPHVLPGRNNHQAVVLPDGRALAIGGAGADNSGKGFRTNTTESFTFEGGWVAEGSMAVRREKHSAVVLQDGNVLVCGGFNGLANVASCEVFNSATSTFAPTGSMAIARINFPMVLLPDGRVFAGFSNAADRVPSAKAEIYDPAAGTWNPIDDAPTARTTTQVVITRRNGHDIVLVIGGGVPRNDGTPPDSINYDHPVSLASVDAFDVQANAWLPEDTYGPLATGRHRHAAVVLPGSGDVLVFGGYYLPYYCECLLDFDPPCTTFNPATGSGDESPYCETDTAELLPLGNTQFESAPSLKRGRSGVATTFLTVPRGTIIDRERNYEFARPGGVAD